MKKKINFLLLISNIFLDVLGCKGVGQLLKKIIRFRRITNKYVLIGTHAEFPYKVDFLLNF